MADIFRSAFTYISSGIGGAAGESERGSELIGELVELGELKLKVKKVIAEGGYGFVYVAVDTVTGKEYAIKRQVVPSDEVKVAKQEISFLKQLKGHPHIIEFIGAAGTPSKQGAAELIIVTELVSGGNMIDIVNTQRLSPGQVLRVFHETCLAVAHMHSMRPPIIHRDLKVENLLLSSKRKIKLCDFGSATINQVIPDHTWSATQRGLAEDEIQRNTTPMYRSPEMIDLYSNYPINEKSDIWALGCLLFKLCYQEHPFEDSAKLRILNANFHIPSDDVAYSPYHELICACLVIEPQRRPSVDAIIAQLFSIADKLGENLDSPHKEPLVIVVQDQPGTQSQTTDQSQNEPGSMGIALQNTSQQAHKLFGMMKGGAENLFKNIKDTSNKVITSVQGGTRSKPLDISYITSRILVMSFPYDTPANSHQNTIEDVGLYLEETHPSQYLVFNLSGEQYDVSKLNGQVVDYEWPFKVVPPLESLVELCRQMDSWLRAEPQNVLVIHCKDGVHPSITLTVLYLLFLKALSSPQSSVRLFLAQRLPEGQGMQITASEKRYMKYMTDLVDAKPFKPHSHSLYILMLRLSSVPLYNEQKNGCTPFIEVFIDGERVFTSCTKDNMSSIRSFTTKDGVVEIPVGVSVCGNLHIIVHHIKSVPGTKTVGMGMSAVKMFHLQFHSGFVSPNSSSITFNRNELDGPAAKRLERFPDPFKISFDLQVESTQQAESGIAWQQLPHPQAHPITCFSTVQEQEEIQDLFGERSKLRPGSNQPKVAPVKPDEGYTQMNDNIAVADLLGESSYPPPNNTGYVPYRDGNKSDSSSSSSDSSSSSSSSADSEAEGHLNTYKPVNNNGQPLPGNTRQQVGGGAELLEDFFSNPSVNIEEANLLEFSTEENTEQEEGRPSDQKQYDPFSMWETTPTFTTATPTSTRNIQDDPFGLWETSTTNFSPASSTAPPKSSTATPQSSTATPSSPTAPSSSFDPFGDWENTTTTTTTASTSAKPTPSSPVHQMGFDPFGPSTSTSGNLLGFTTTSAHLQLPPKPFTSSTKSNSWSSFGDNVNNSSSQNVKQHDPFGDIWNQASGSSKPTNNQNPLTGFRMGSPRMPSPAHQPVMTNRPMYNVGSKGGANFGGRGSSTGGLNVGGRGSGTGGLNVGGKGSNVGGGTSNGARPRSVSPNDPKPNKFGPVPNQHQNRFDDLLDQNLFTNKGKEQSGSVPLNTLMNKSGISKITDPDRAKVAEWANGKEHNIRALISSLHTILWENETRWKPIGMHQLVEGDQVGKFFRKACLSVHPDKAQDTPHENLARAIFDELNDAYELFESSGSKSLYQT